jgi:hypothetical protein
MQAGELIVTGRDKAHIILHGYPREVSCHFTHATEHVPCNPHHEDWLEYEVHAHKEVHGGFILVIKWHVSGVREIAWHVHY